MADIFSSASGYSFNWVDDVPQNWPYDSSDWNDHSLNTPVPCKKGVLCSYEGKFVDGVWRAGGCAFVHPGEEGVGRLYCSARFVYDKMLGKKVRQEECIRLYGTPEKRADFYERRRLHMSWPAWCKMKGIQIPASAPAPASGPAILPMAPSHKRKQIVDLGEFPALGQKEEPLLLQKEEKHVHFAPPPSAPKVLSFWDLPQGSGLPPVPSALDAQVNPLAPPPSVRMAAAPEPWIHPWGLTQEEFCHILQLPASMPLKQSLGEVLYMQIAKIFQDKDTVSFLAEHGLMTPKATPGKIVGMILDAYDEQDLLVLIQNSSEQQQITADALFLLKDATA